MVPEVISETAAITRAVSYGRETKQDRSSARRQRITEGAIVAISRYGIAGVTHRRVAQEAHVSLAATTYYYGSKRDIIADASHTLLARYVEAFERFAHRQRENAGDMTLCDFVMRLVSNAVEQNATDSLAWCEIILNTVRDPNLRELSQTWFDTLALVWRDIAHLLRAEDVEDAATSAIDTVVGYLFLAVPLASPKSELNALLADETWGQASPQLAQEQRLRVDRLGPKAEETRRRILDAAVEILVIDGAEALTFRHVSQKAKLSIAAPTYYFSTISTLWNAAQLRLFEQAKVRYRSVMDDVEWETLSIPELADLTTTVFMREATEFRDLSLSSYPVYLQSRREASLQAGLAAINAEQLHRWRQALGVVAPHETSKAAWIMYALFTGKLIRAMATGTQTRSLRNVRKEFTYDITALAAGSHWSTQNNGTSV